MKDIEDLRFGAEDAECITDSAGRGQWEREIGERYKVQLLANAMMAGPEVVPQLWNQVQSVAESLGVDHFDLFIVPDQDVQAMCMKVPSRAEGRLDQENVCMTLSAGLIQRFEPEEIKFVIGHELGHYLLGHHGYPAVESAKEPWQKKSLVELHHYAELSADRVGICACASKEVGLSALVKLASGLPSQHLGTDFTSFVTQLRLLEGYTGHGDLSGSSHPLLPLRARNLVLFSQTDVFKEWVGEGSASLTVEACDQAVLRSYGEVSGLTEATRRSLDLAKFWCCFSLFSIDNRLSREEQDWLKAKFGEHMTSGGMRFIDANLSDVKGAIEHKVLHVLARSPAFGDTEMNEVRSTLYSALEVATGEVKSIEAAVEDALDLVDRLNPHVSR